MLVSVAYSNIPREKTRMRKSVITVAVSSAFAFPMIASAQTAAPAAPAAPTFDKVLEASGISLSGYVDAAYTHADRDIERGFSPRVFDQQNNSFALHQVGLQIAKQPKEGFGGLVNVTAGKDAQVIHSLPENSAPGNAPSSTSMFDITQAYGQYASGALTLMAGKFTTLHGTEVIWSPSNANFSRSILFGSVPFTHTGVRAVFAANDMISLTAGVNNGWDQLADTNRGKTTELGITVTPIKPVSVSASYYGGQENSTTTAVAGRRDSFNLVASWNIIEPLTISGEYLRVQQKDAIFDATGSTAKATYSGVAGYLSYLFMPKLKGTVRVEAFDDKDAFRFGMPGGTTSGSKYKEYTLTMAYMPADSFELRGEIRQDRANQQVFTGDNGSFSKNMTTFAVQALYKF
jgi:hypothetical protein